MSEMSAELAAAITKLKAARGTPQEQLARDSAVSRFLADLPSTTRVFCRGDVRTDKGWFPAALTLNTIYGQVLAWAPSGRKNAMESHSPSSFFSSTPYAAIAREVLDYPDTTAIAIETQRAETENTGSVAKP